MTTNASFRSIASWLSDNIASVFRNSFLCHASFWLQVKQRALWFAQLLSKPREARSLRSPVQSASCTAVEALQAQFPMFPMFPSRACRNQFLSINLPAFLRLFESVLHALQSLCACPHDLQHNMHIQGNQHIDQSWWRRDVEANDNQRLLSKHCQLAFWQHCVSFPQQLPLPCQFLTSGKTTRSLICPTTSTFLASQWGSIPAFSCTKCQLHGCWSIPGPVSNVSNVSKSSLLEPTSKHQSTCFLAVVWKRPARSPVPMCLPTWPSAQHAHPRKATSMNRGEEEMLKPMTTNASFRSIASWLCDNIASVFRNSFLCHASFWLQVKQRALRFAQLLSKPVRLDPCVLLYKVPVARLLKHSRHSFQCFQCFQVKLAGTNF